eukprot:6477785-Amphidinium_carterae.1
MVATCDAVLCCLGAKNLFRVMFSGCRSQIVASVGHLQTAERPFCKHHKSDKRSECGTHQRLWKNMKFQLLLLQKYETIASNSNSDIELSTYIN